MDRKVLLAAVDIRGPTSTTWSRQDLTTAEESLEELEELVRSLGDEVVGQTIQMRAQLDKRYLVGSGKVKELALLVQEMEIDVVVFDHELSPLQVRNLERALERPVLDRTAIILEIFAARAQSREGKLQVELARLKYLLPRLTGKGTALSRLGGGIGTRGPGEQQLEFRRRHLRTRIHELEGRIEEIKQHRGLIRQNREKNRVPVVALVGYTNAGKSTLLQALTGGEAYIDDRVFATLDPQARGFRTPGGLEVVVIDTVGFIRQLPHQLVAAFRATLEEVLFADLLVHVVDASRPGIDNRMDAVMEVLREIGAAEQRILVAFNQIDRLDADEMDRLRAEYSSPLLISARQQIGLGLLKQAIENQLCADSELITLLIPYHRGDLLNYLHQQALIVARHDAPEGITIEARCERRIVDQLRPYVESENE